MELQFAGLYPNLAALIQELPVRIPKDRRVYKAFKEYGEFTDEQAKKVLTGGTSPTIRVGPLGPTTWGNTPDTADHCTLNEIIIRQFEDVCFAATSGNVGYLTSGADRDHRQHEWNYLLSRAKLTIEALLLHEVVHWGDGRTYPGSAPDKYLHEDGTAKRAGYEDRGHEFARAAYGNKLPFIKNSKGYWITDHEIAGWIGIWKVGKSHIGGWTPLEQTGPAPIRPPPRPR